MTILYDFVSINNNTYAHCLLLFILNEKLFVEFGLVITHDESEIKYIIQILEKKEL